MRLKVEATLHYLIPYRADVLLPPVEPTRQPLVDKGFAPQPALAQAGGGAFAGSGCIVCHGMNAIGGGAAPDLRYSPMILNAEGFKAIVQEGALKPNGMPPYPQLDDKMVEAIRHYLRTRAMVAAREDAGEAVARPKPAAVQGL